MNVFKYEIKQNLNFLIKWCLGLFIFTALVMQAAPMFVDESGAIKDMLSSMGETFTKALNINADTFFSEVGFFSYIFIYLGLICAIEATMLGINILSKERRMKTADFLISKPKSRTKIFWEKVLAAFVCIIITEIVFFISAYLSILYVSKGVFAFTPFALMCGSLFFIQIIFLGIGLFTATFISKIKSPISITMGITFGIFFLGMIDGFTSSEILRYLSPLRYFDNNYIITHGVYEYKYIIISLVLSLILISTSYVVYKNKDVESV